MSFWTRKHSNDGGGVAILTGSWLHGLKAFVSKDSLSCMLPSNVVQHDAASRQGGSLKSSAKYLSDSQTTLIAPDKPLDAGSRPLCVVLEALVPALMDNAGSSTTFEGSVVSHFAQLASSET